MIHSIQSSVPCLGNAHSCYDQVSSSSDVPDTVTKIVLVVSGILAGLGALFLSLLPPIGGACLLAAAAGLLFTLVYNLAKEAPLKSQIEMIENLEGAEALAEGVELSESALETLKETIPSIDAIELDSRVTSINYNADKTATFTLRDAPGLKFRMGGPEPSSRLGCEEFRLARRYENMVYAKEICMSQNFDALVVPPTKAIYVQVEGLRRSLLVEKVIESQNLPPQQLERAVRQMVQFYLLTGGASSSDAIPFTPTEGSRGVGKLVLRNLHHLTENPHPDPTTREFEEVDAILGRSRSVLAALEDEALVEIAMNELRNLRPINLGVAEFRSEEAAIEFRERQIREARERRLQQLQNPETPPQQPIAPPPPNLLGVTPEDLNLNLELKDYAIVKFKGVYSDGVSKIVSLGEVAGTIIDKINQKLQENPAQPNIVFSPEEMLIGRDLPTFDWEQHYQYNNLRGLGIRGLADGEESPPYWMALVLQALQNRGLIERFNLPYSGPPTLRVNLRALLPRA